MANNSEEGQGPQRAVVPMMMMMINDNVTNPGQVIINSNLIKILKHTFCPEDSFEYYPPIYAYVPKLLSFLRLINLSVFYVL
jgi:hypothetical protein